MVPHHGKHQPRRPHRVVPHRRDDNPAISVPARAHVTAELINAGTDMAYGLVILPVGAALSAMPIMTASAFTGSALWTALPVR